MIDYSIHNRINEDNSDYSEVSSALKSMCDKFAQRIESGVKITTRETMTWFRAVNELYESSAKYKTMIFITSRDLMIKYTVELKHVFSSNNTDLTRDDFALIRKFKQNSEDEIRFINRATDMLKDLGL